MDVRLVRKIEAIRVHIGMSKTELAEAAPYHLGKLTDMLNETGPKKDINVATLESLAAALNHHVALLPGPAPDSDS